MGPTVADALVIVLKREGVRHVFGVPGGGSSHDIIRACGNPGIEFLQIRTASAAAQMAVADAKLSGRSGVCMASRGPGASNADIGVRAALHDSVPFIGGISLQAARSGRVAATADPAQSPALAYIEAGES